ncbi:MAG: EscU/YscU/HrcU family type III secretion system export apparatus switch protein [Gammaproteobacteria bacterium]|nr:EscU/YscU/HrcU family type III secretion system export apparatus switch protein [Gammaproteobacteria bacterium]
MSNKLDVYSKTSAVALHYSGLGAPIVTAKGEGLIAEKILEIARANNVPLHEDRELVKLLSNIELGAEIPEQLYQVVARVIAFAYSISGKQPPLPEPARPVDDA